jgi:hypothetical protein
MRACQPEFPQIIDDGSHGPVGHQALQGIGSVVAQGEEVLRQLPCRPVLGPIGIKLEQPEEDRKEIYGLSYLLAERPRPSVDVLHFCGGLPSSGYEHRAQRGQQVQLVLESCGGLRQGAEHL